MTVKGTKMDNQTERQLDRKTFRQQKDS